MKKIRNWVCFVTFAALCVCVLQVVCQQRDLSSKLVRLHVVANSDSAEDQALKLQVRDAVLAQVSDLTADCSSKEQTVAVLQAHLLQLDQTAQQVLQAAGCSDSVRVSLCQEDFPTRLYPTFSLPAGEYTSLRISLGEAEGRNWWCVVFPTLCTAAQTEDLQEVAVASGFSEQEVALMTGDAPQYTVKFKILEGLEKLKALFCAS